MSIQLDQKDRRKSVRLALRVGYTLTVGDRGFKGVTGNISLGGVYLQEIDPVIPESFVSETGFLQIELPESQITLECTISYVGTDDSSLPADVGVAFFNPDVKSVSIVQDCITKLKNKVTDFVDNPQSVVV